MIKVAHEPLISTNVCVHVAILCQLVSSIFAVKKFIGQWEKVSMLVPALPVPQFMDCASLHTFSTGRNMEVHLRLSQLGEKVIAKHSLS